MNISQERHGAVTVVRPEGALSGTDVDEVRGRLLETMTESLGRCALDASEIPFVDSYGLEMLLDVTETMAQSGQALKLCEATETVRQVLELTGLAPSFDFYDSPLDAVRSFM